MHKSHKHRRTQSNSEVDLKQALRHDLSEDRKHFIEIYQTADHIPRQENKEIIIEKLEDDYDLIQQKENCGLTFGNKVTQKKRNFGSYQPDTLFLIPEQNDLLSSVEQTQESAQKISIKKPDSATLLQQIQMLQQQLGLKDITNQQTERNQQEIQCHKLSFTNELSKKKKSLQLKVTPDRKRIPSQYPSKGSNKQQDSSTKNNLTVSMFNHLKKQSISCNKKDKDTCDSYRKIESQMKNIEKEISQIKKRQDHLDEVNRAIQSQLFDILSDSKKQKELSSISLRKLEQLESITRRNEESISFIRSNMNFTSKRMDSHQTDSTELSDYPKRFQRYM